MKSKLRLEAIAAYTVVAGRIVVMPVLMLILAVGTNYMANGSMFIGADQSYFGFAQQDPVMVGGCTNCSIGCIKVFQQVLRLKGEAIMSKQEWMTMYTPDFLFNESVLTNEMTELAVAMDNDGVAKCISGANDWGSDIMTIAGDPQYVIDVINLLNVSVAPKQLRELELGLINKHKCPTRWVLLLIVRLFKFKQGANTTTYFSIPVADFNIFPEYTECRPDVSNEFISGSKLALETHGVDPLAIVPSAAKLFPYDMKSSLKPVSDLIPASNTIYHASSVTQPLLLAYYGGCRVREVNKTGVYVEDTCTILPHWESYGVMIQVPDDVPVCSTTDVCVHNYYNSKWESIASLDKTVKYDHVFLRVNSFRSRFTDSVPSSVLPGVVVIQLLVMGIMTLYQTMSHKRSVLLTQIWAYKCQNGHMQVVYLAQITYHLAANSDLYYLGLTTGTLSFESIANLTMSFFAFSYSFVNLMKARSGEQQLDRYFRLAWEILQLLTTTAVGVLLYINQQTSIAYIMTHNGELLRKASERGAKYCNLSDSCIVFKTNLAVVMILVALGLGIVPFIIAFVLNGRTLRQRVKYRVIYMGSNASRRFTSFSKRSSAMGSKVFSPTRLSVTAARTGGTAKGTTHVGGDVPNTLTSFEKYCLGGSFSALFNDCDDIAYTVNNDHKCSSVEAVLLAGFLYYGENIYQAPSVMLLLAARNLPGPVLRSFNILFLRWHIDKKSGAIGHPATCTWYSASAEKHSLSQAVPIS